ncbi:hypothetical protein NQZ68_007952 [Dissostichus eleginoides]|nr:hypothetical protein NQZ68_007952 [Dissostichus eleginoides]
MGSIKGYSLVLKTDLQGYRIEEIPEVQLVVLKSEEIQKALRTPSPEQHKEQHQLQSAQESSEELEDIAQTEQSCQSAVYFSLPMLTTINTNLGFGQALRTPRNSINCRVLKKNP